MLALRRRHYMVIALIILPIFSHASKKDNVGDIIQQFLKKRENGASTGSQDKESGCTCVPFKLCADRAVLVDAIDIRGGDGVCDDYLEVCCKKPLSPDNEIIPAKPASKGCGKRNPFGFGFSISGNENGESQFGEFPWMVAVIRTIAKAHIYQCGGALIHPQVVLTAAHCVPDDIDYMVRVGEWDTQTNNELLPHQDVAVNEVVIHPYYDPGSLHNDAALLFLKTPVTLAGNVHVICLPLQNENFDYSRCYASGWGRDTFGKEGLSQMIMKKVEMPVVPHDACEESLRRTRKGPKFELLPSFICAGGEKGRDTCKGDGGSPLACPIGDTDRYAHAGIVSWGVGCGKEGTPGVYTAVATIRTWIDDLMERRNLFSDELQSRLA